MRRIVRGKALPLAALAAFLCCAAAYGSASSGRGEVAALVVYTEGAELSVVDARGVTVRTDPVDPVGTELVAGDTLVTEHGTFVELQLVPSTNLVRVAENTNFTIVQRGSPRGGTFDLIYGKVRARVGKLTEQDTFRIRSQSAVAGVRGTDFGVSVEVGRPAAEEPEGKPGGALAEAAPVTQVFCLEGEVEVAPVPPAATEGAEAAPVVSVVVRANEMVTVSPEENPREVKTEPLPAELKSFWEKNDFKAEPVAAPLAAATVQVEPEAKPAPPTAAPPSGSAEPAASVAPASASPAPAARQEPQGSVPAVVVEDPLQQLIARTQRSRLGNGVASLGLFAVGAVVAALGLVDATVPSVSFFGDNGFGLMGAGGAMIAGGVYFAFEFARVNRALRELELTGRAP
jgi:hypothetical protein